MYTFMEVNELYERASLLPDLAPDQGWIGQSGQLHRGCDTTARRTWLTAEQAAERFNVTVREINERYRPIMELTYPGSVLPPLTEVLYEYDFEGPNFNWEGYEERQKELLTVDPYGRSFYCYPEMAKGFVPDEDEDGDALRLKAHDECGYDKGLEPKSRTVRVCCTIR